MGKIFKMKGAMKAGLGYSLHKEGDLEIAVISAVNALGDIIDENGKIIAGTKLGKFLQEAPNIIIYTQKH